MIDLTPIEKRVLRLISLGCTNRQAGALLHCSEKTVDNHRTRLMKKLGIRNTSALVRYALKASLSSLEDVLTPNELRIAGIRGAIGAPFGLGRRRAKDRSAS